MPGRRATTRPSTREVPSRSPARAPEYLLRDPHHRASDRAGPQSVTPSAARLERTADWRSSDYPQKSGIGTSADKALRILGGDGATGERIASTRLVHHELLDGSACFPAPCLAQLQQNLLPGSLERVILVDRDAVRCLRRLPRLPQVLLLREAAEKCAEQLELSARVVVR